MGGNAGENAGSTRAGRSGHLLFRQGFPQLNAVPVRIHDPPKFSLVVFLDLRVDPDTFIAQSLQRRVEIVHDVIHHCGRFTLAKVRRRGRKIHHAVKLSFEGLSGCAQRNMEPASPSLTMPRCLAYQARRASGFSDLKKTPPMPRTRVMGRMLRDQFH